MISIISQSNIDNPKGVILEAPFNNIREEVIKHPFSWVRLNLFLKFITQVDNSGLFEDEERIRMKTKLSIKEKI